jgi:hypothetical protein
MATAEDIPRNLKCVLPPVCQSQAEQKYIIIGPLAKRHSNTGSKCKNGQIIGKFEREKASTR